MKFFKVLCFVFLVNCAFVEAQELNASVTVVTLQTGNDNNVVFKTLEKQLNEFINGRQWTNEEYTDNEKINCSFVINVSSYRNDRFDATLQVQATRPVFNSAYNSPIYNFNDQDFSFNYLEFQNLVFNKDQFESNLISVLTFHIYMILGIDADTFKEFSGTKHFKQAQTILNYSQTSGAQGWRLQDGLNTRFILIDNMLSNTFNPYRTAMYQYHREVLDVMSENLKSAKEQMASVLNNLLKLHNKRPNSLLMRTFFDAKATEIKDIYTGGPSVSITSVVPTLNKIAPSHSTKWNAIRF